MKKTTSIFTAILIAGTILMSLHTASAQEWRLLIDKNMFTRDQPTQTPQKGPGEENDWLGTKTPLLKNKAITGLYPNNTTLRAPQFETEFSQVGSWAPLQSAPGKENFTLFSF